MIIPAPANTKKHGTLQVHIYDALSNVPVNNAKVTIGNKVLEFLGEGIYSYTFRPPTSDEPLFVEINVSGVFNGISFQKQYLERVPVLNGDIVFTDKFEWHIDNSAKTIALGFDVQVNKPALYGIAATMTDVTQRNNILDGPYRVTKFLAYRINDEMNCDLIIKLDLIPVLEIVP